MNEEGRNVLFNDTLNTFYLLLYGTDIWLKTTEIREEPSDDPSIGQWVHLRGSI